MAVLPVSTETTLLKKLEPQYYLHKNTERRFRKKINDSRSMSTFRLFSVYEYDPTRSNLKTHAYSRFVRKLFHAEGKIVMAI